MKTKRSAALQETVVTSGRLCLRPMKNEEWNRIVDSVYENDEFLFQFGFDARFKLVHFALLSGIKKAALRGL